MLLAYYFFQIMCAFNVNELLFLLYYNDLWDASSHASMPILVQLKLFSFVQLAICKCNGQHAYLARVLIAIVIARYTPVCLIYFLDTLHN